MKRRLSYSVVVVVRAAQVCALFDPQDNRRLRRLHLKEALEMVPEIGGPGDCTLNGGLRVLHLKEKAQGIAPEREGSGYCT